MSFSSICSQNRSSCAEQKRLSQNNQAIGFILASLIIISGLSVANSEVVKILEGKTQIFERPQDETHERNLEISRQLDNSKPEILTITPGITTYGFIMENETLFYRFDSSGYNSRGHFLVISYQPSNGQIIPQLKVQANSSGAYLISLWSQQMPKNHLIYEIVTFKSDNVILEFELKDFDIMLHDKSPKSKNMFFDMKISNSNTVNELTDKYELVYFQSEYWAHFKSNDDRKRAFLVKYRTTDQSFDKSIFCEQWPDDFDISEDNLNKLLHSIDSSTLYLNNLEYSHDIVLKFENKAFLEIKMIIMPFKFDQFYSKMIIPKDGQQYSGFKITPNQVEYEFKEVLYDIIPEMNFSNIHFVYHAYLTTSSEAIFAIMEDREISGEHTPALHQTIKPDCEQYQCRDQPKHKVVFPWKSNSETSTDIFYFVVRAELIFEQAHYDTIKLTQEPVSFQYIAKLYNPLKQPKNKSRNKLIRRENKDNLDFFS